MPYNFRPHMGISSFSRAKRHNCCVWLPTSRTVRYLYTSNHTRFTTIQFRERQMSITNACENFISEIENPCDKKLINLTLSNNERHACE